METPTTDKMTKRFTFRYVDPRKLYVQPHITPPKRKWLCVESIVWWIQFFILAISLFAATPIGSRKIVGLFIPI